MGKLGRHHGGCGWCIGAELFSTVSLQLQGQVPTFKNSLGASQSTQRLLPLALRMA